MTLDKIEKKLKPDPEKCPVCGGTKPSYSELCNDCTEYRDNKIEAARLKARIHKWG